MFSHEEVTLGKQRSARLRRLSGYLMIFIRLLTAAFLLGCVLVFLQPGGMRSGMWLAPLCAAIIVFLIGTWCEAISQSVADTFELVEDVHHALRKQQEDHHAEG
jgi:hypothetical protein